MTQMYLPRLSLPFTLCVSLSQQLNLADMFPLYAIRPEKETRRPTPLNYRLVTQTPLRPRICVGTDWSLNTAVCHRVSPMISVYEHTLQNPRRINYSWWRKATPYGTRPGRGQSVNIIIMIILRKEEARFLRDGWAELGLYREETRKKNGRFSRAGGFRGWEGGGGGVA